ncbi:MAG: methyltransferase [Clostridia bacterium]|nr:methyltransferase [Clostridia bacterium]
MSALVTAIPIIIIRYAFLNILNKEALKRAAYFAPLVGRERIAYWVYQITTLFIMVDLLLLKIKVDSDWFCIGVVTYSFGLVLYAISMLDYARPKTNGINVNGLYRISRNPMYIAYFICLFGCVLISNSWTLFTLLIVFQISSHWIILSEERWCIKKFGGEYMRYMDKVRRYI